MKRRLVADGRRAAGWSRERKVREKRQLDDARRCFGAHVAATALRSVDGQRQRSAWDGAHAGHGVIAYGVGYGFARNRP